MIWRKVSSAKINPINGDLLRSKGHITLHAIFSRGDWILSSSVWICLDPSEIHPKLKSRKILFAYSFSHRQWILLKFHTDHGSHTVVLCAKLQKDPLIKMGAMREEGLRGFSTRRMLGRSVYLYRYGFLYLVTPSSMPSYRLVKSRTFETLVYIHNFSLKIGSRPCITAVEPPVKFQGNM